MAAAKQTFKLNCPNFPSLLQLEPGAHRIVIKQARPSFASRLWRAISSWPRAFPPDEINP
jgi:hypothetical protein